MVSIVVLIYNEERYIIDTLESIKYQITTFGMNQEVQLILQDDCSRDRSVELVELWLQENEDLFAEVIKSYGKQNLGTCIRYGEGLRAVKGDRHITIAGDDLFSLQNLFNILEKSDSKDIMMNAVLCFNEKGIITELNAYNDIALQCLVTDKSIHWESKLGSPVLNGAVFKKELITEDVIQYIEKYTLVNDRPSVYKMAHDKEDLSVGYQNCPILLSRRHNQSVSSLHSPHLKTHNADLDKLYSDVINNENNFLIKWSAIRQRSNVKFRGSKGLKSKIKYLSPFYFAIGFRALRNFKKIKYIKKELISNYAVENNKYLNDIQKLSGDFYRKHNVSFEP